MLAHCEIESNFSIYVRCNFQLGSLLNPPRCFTPLSICVTQSAFIILSEPGLRAFRVSAMWRIEASAGFWSHR